MKRTKSNETAPRRKGEIKWTRIGGGSSVLVINGKQKMLVQNRVVWALPEEVPEGVRDVVVPVHPEDLGDVEKTESINVAKLEYTVVPKKGGYYDVVNSDGKVINEKSLRKDAAQELIDSLT